MAVQTGVARGVAREVVAPRRQRGLWSDAWRRLSANRLAMAGLAYVLLLVLVAIFADLIAPFDPIYVRSHKAFQPPNELYWWGADDLGRDIFSRMVYGTRISLTVGLVAQMAILAIGIPIGAIAAYAGGRVDNILMRITDVFYAFPDLLFAIIIMVWLGPSVFNVIVAISIVSWTGMARLVRGQLLSLKEREFVLAARCVGVPPSRILVRHLLPNALGPVIVSVTFGIPGAIFTEAALSFIGIGVKPPAPSWGTMVERGFAAIFAHPYQVAIPCAVIAATMMAFSFLGDGLRDALDPRA